MLHNPRRLAEIMADAEPGPRRIALAMERARLGAVFPFEVFPIWGAAELEELGLFRENPVTAAMPETTARSTFPPTKGKCTRRSPSATRTTSPPASCNCVANAQVRRFR